MFTDQPGGGASGSEGSKLVSGNGRCVYVTTNQLYA